MPNTLYVNGERGHCSLGATPKPDSFLRKEASGAVPVQVHVAKMRSGGEVENGGKIMLQPRMCTLRSYGEDRFGVLEGRMKEVVGDCEEVSPFFVALSDYIESSEKSHDFEIISGRLAMIVFAATVGTEVVTGNSVFRKMDLQGITEAAGACFGAVTFSAIFAWFCSARNRVSRNFTISCNAFIDSLIDEVVDALFYEIDSSDWADEL